MLSRSVTTLGVPRNIRAGGSPVTYRLYAVTRENVEIEEPFLKSRRRCRSPVGAARPEYKGGKASLAKGLFLRSFRLYKGVALASTVELRTCTLRIVKLKQLCEGLS